ncbi:MAG: TolC family protein [Anaerolineae bacterium]|nr:TolC family protein [Gemmatimonadaceae bacterium]
MQLTSVALLAPLAALLLASTASAQAGDSVVGPVLTLEEAQSLARRYNPDHQQIRNNRRVATAALKSAWGNLLPSADALFQGQQRQGGTQPINGVNFSTSDIRQSSYWLGLNYNISAATLLNPRVQKANVAAADADVTLSTEVVHATVAQQYLTTLQAEARAALQDSLVITSEAQLELVQARAAVGSGTQLDVVRAQVTLGQARVTALQAHNTAEIEKLRLFERMGVPQPANVRLTSTFEVAEPTFSLQSVLDMAQRRSPALEALRSRDKSASLVVRQAQSQYLPALSLSTGWGGYTYEYTNSNFLIEQQRLGIEGQRANCFFMDSLRTGANLPPTSNNCALIAFTPAQADRIRSENSQFPFNFTKQPRAFTATVSLPLFDGFTREQRIQEAQAGRSNARYLLRARELQLTQEVTAAYLTLTTAARTVALQGQNAERAREELNLAQERYRVGASTFLEVTEARASVERAETERINAIYDYHKAFAALESAVGRSLR